MTTPSIQQLALTASHKLERFLKHQARGNYNSLAWTTELDRLLREYIDALTARDEARRAQQTSRIIERDALDTCQAVRLALLSGAIINCQHPTKELPPNYNKP